MEYKIIFDVKEGSKTVVFSKDFQELKNAFDWAEWFQQKHAWVNEYKIKPMFEKRRSNKK